MYIFFRVGASHIYKYVGHSNFINLGVSPTSLFLKILITQQIGIHVWFAISKTISNYMTHFNKLEYVTCHCRLLLGNYFCVQSFMYKLCGTFIDETRRPYFSISQLSYVYQRSFHNVSDTLCIKVHFSYFLTMWFNLSAVLYFYTKYKEC